MHCVEVMRAFFGAHYLKKSHKKGLFGVLKETSDMKLKQVKHEINFDSNPDKPNLTFSEP